MKITKLMAGVIVLASLSACGLKGDLERPDPIFQEREPQPAPAEPPVKETPKAEEKQDVPDDELLGGPL